MLNNGQKRSCRIQKYKFKPQTVDLFYKTPIWTIILSLKILKVLTLQTGTKMTYLVYSYSILNVKRAPDMSFLFCLETLQSRYVLRNISFFHWTIHVVDSLSWKQFSWTIRDIQQIICNKDNKLWWKIHIFFSVFQWIVDVKKINLEKCNVI